MDDSEVDHFLSDEGQRQPDATVFTLNGESIPIHLHHSLGSGGRNAMAKKIEVFRPPLPSAFHASFMFFSSMRVEIHMPQRTRPA